MPLMADVAPAATALPVLHKDPFDRLLKTTTMGRGFTILTSDEKTHQYPQLKTL